MRVSAQGFWAPKLGNKDSEYEDAYCPRRELISQEDSSFHFAVADGATETSFSGLWAKQLVRAFSKGMSDGPRIQQGIGALRDKWQKIVSRRPLPWYAEEKVRSGAFAALAGLILEDANGMKRQGTWRGIAVGDSCIFHLRRKRVLLSFPITKSEDFNNSPRLLSSRRPENQRERAKIGMTSGLWQEEDTFYLMTDAIACWFMKRAESDNVPARELADLTGGDGSSFRLWLKELREESDLRNDDVTILRVEIERE